MTTRGLAYPAGPLHRVRWGAREEACLVTVESDDGVVGTSIARSHHGLSHTSIADGVRHVLAPLIIGRRLDDPGDVKTLWSAMMHLHLAQYVPVFAVSALDTALWDLLGRAAGRPVAALLCDKPAGTVPVYASLPHFDGVADALRSAEATLAAGFSALKVHSTGRHDHDIEVCRKLRAELPAGTPLMFDATRRLDRPAAERLAALLTELRFAWFEEPFEPFDVDSHRWLAGRCGIPVAAFETAPGGPDAARWAMEQRLAELLLIDCYWKAGLTGALAVADDAARLGQRLIMHHGASATMNAANIQLVAARPELGHVELLVPYGQYDVGVVLPELVPGAGLRVPAEPGIGFRLDDEFLDSHTVAGSVRATDAPAGVVP
ncbi:mandelate racemase/muconate lactonizing enzyme family protein [Nonomuraea sp. NPDC046570]|uniref:mandelate racemase/muconate lactonizing enzyme family protein n=1 Tax=Nonomuraea sp. NPDC046570 TaxID=3155255 RepID=UPI00340E7436